ncbi:MAG: ATP synthase F1 subunit gamma [Oscillospiraceae bacterium]|jgi:F-type H+-transporting ATPase subunit gamma|nr:ATP synthase F1 subunit gamma [Oscillospiraceae bacterium]
MAKGNMKTIKRRIKSVGSTMKITKAMEMVASSKFRRAKTRAESSRPFFETLYSLLSDIARETDTLETVFTRSREVKNSLYIVVAGDRGLAGGYNSTILKQAVHAHEGGPLPKVVAIGKKSIEYFRKHGYELLGEYPDFSEYVDSSDCADIAISAADMFRSGEVDEVVVFFTTFISALSQRPSRLKLLPLDDITEQDGEVDPLKASTYDPSAEAVFDRIVPKFIASAVQCACGESYASEQSARRNAMKNASENAEDMIENLSLLYNRARQEKITNEINEIVAGANAI